MSQISGEYEDYVFFLTRLVSHFPRRDINQDGVIISDIAGALQQNKISALVCSVVCAEVWKEATVEKPFMPPPGAILRAMVKKQNEFDDRFQRLLAIVNSPPQIAAQTAPKASKAATKWADMTKEERIAAAGTALFLQPPVRDTYLDCIDADMADWFTYASEDSGE